MQNSTTTMSETILIVDDEEPVRRTFREWLDNANLGCQLLSAGDAASALALADKHHIDLAILDWNLGAGHDGLELLEDLTLFNPDIVAVMVTGFANQATPLMAMRMGVRDYLDKNQDLDQKTFLQAVTKQLELIRPAKRQKRLLQGLNTFRTAVEQVLPLVQTAQALHDPVPLPSAISRLFSFLLELTNGTDGALLVHSHDPARQPPELFRAYDRSGRILNVELIPFSRSIASSILSLQEPGCLDSPDKLAAEGSFLLQPFEKGRQSILAAPVQPAHGYQVVLELFDRRLPDGKIGSFRPEDRQLLRRASELAGELLRQALAERNSQRILFDAVAAALKAGDEVAQSITTVDQAINRSPSVEVMEQIQAGLREMKSDTIDEAMTLQLAESIRVLAVRHGPRAVEHCARMIHDLRGLLDEVTAMPEEVRM